MYIYILHFTEDAILYDKEIMITAHIADQLELSKYRGRFSVVKKEVCTPEELQFQYDNVYRSCLYDLDTPVIGVMGQGKNCGKFHCQLLLSRILENECQAVVLSSNPLGALYGFYTMPDFLYDSIPFYEKVIKFNTYIRMIERKENPDIIIIGIPEGIVPFEQREFNHFAEYALVITSAITIDAGILCTYFVHGKLLSKGIDDLMTFCSTKFGMPMEAMCISNIYCEVPHSDISPIIYEFLDDSYMCKYGPNISDIAAHVFDFRELDRMTTIVQNILCCLSSGIRVI